MSRLLKYLPKYERKSEVFEELLNADRIELDNLDDKIKDLEKQLNVDTATWGLAIYEKELGIKTNINKPLDDRRSVVKSKWRGTGKVDNILLKAVADAYTNGNVDVGFDGKIIIKFNDVFGIPPNLDDVYKSLGEIVPAHLALAYEFMYLLIKDIHEVMTIEEIENTTLDKFAF